MDTEEHRKQERGTEGWPRVIWMPGQDSYWRDEAPGPGAYNDKQTKAAKVTYDVACQVARRLRSEGTEATIIRLRPKPGRHFETEVSACCHRVVLRWWDVRGDVTDKQLEDTGEAHARECIADDYGSGQLVHDDVGSSALGWWEIVTPVGT